MPSLGMLELMKEKKRDSKTEKWKEQNQLQISWMIGRKTDRWDEIDRRAHLRDIGFIAVVRLRFLFLLQISSST